MGCLCFGRKKKLTKYSRPIVPKGYGGPKGYQPKPKKKKQSNCLPCCIDCFSTGVDVTAEAGGGGDGGGGGGCGGGGGGWGGGCGGGGAGCWSQDILILC